MTESEVRSILTEYRKCYRDLRTALEQIQNLNDKALATGSLAPKEIDVLSSGSLSARWEQWINDKVDLEAIIQEESDKLKEKRKQAYDLIRLADIHYQPVLFAYYLEGKTNKEVAEAFKYEPRTVQRIRHKAIVRISKVVVCVS